MLIDEYTLPKDNKRNGRIAVEFGPTDISKPLCLNGIKNICIGTTIANMLKFQGYDVQKTTLINDRISESISKIYEKYGICFDIIEKENETYDRGHQMILDALANKKVTQLDNGSVQCDLIEIGVLPASSKENNKLCLAQSIVSGISRLEKTGFDKMIYVSDEKQTRHFDILYKLSKHINPNANNFIHLPYKTIEMECTTARRDRYISADNLFSQVFEKVRQTNSYNTENEAKTNIITMAAIKFFMLSPQIYFNIEKSLSSTEKSGPFILYQHVRIKNILKKMNVTQSNVFTHLCFLHLLDSDVENDLLKKLLYFPKKVTYAIDKLDTGKLVNAIYEIAASFRKMYGQRTNYIIYTDDPAIQSGRVGLIWITKNAIERGMKMCNIELLE